MSDPAHPVTTSAADVPVVTGSLFPEPFKSRIGGRRKRKLGDVFGLSQFGVNLVELDPGQLSALRHWHSLEEEFVYVLEGELALITDSGESLLRAGDCAGYRAGTGDAHHMVNRGTTLARYLEVGSRCPGDLAFYPDEDLIWLVRGKDGRTEEVAAHKDGRPY